MGVPKFFRYISERYPCLLEMVREQNMPDFDNFYLDMNGIVHNCSHPDDSNYALHVSEDQMFRDIFNYVDKLFFLIKPKKLLLLAVDGVAPRAKMNQQRSRRFQTAKTATKQQAEAKEQGIQRKEALFDTNCITPGTEFMERLHRALKYFVKNKISNDPLWQKVKVILSGPDCPGEGEHKIMNYIRYLKSQKDFDPNLKHCLYGLDADLIILGLCTHELHFAVLREEVIFNKHKQKSKSVEETKFFLLHLSLLREYLTLEFDELKKIDKNFDIAKVIDDWILMGFMVGNDFIPHLPCLHISTNTLPVLYQTYIKVYPELGGNINEEGKLNLARLEKFFALLADFEYEKFQEDHKMSKGFEGKSNRNAIEEAFDVEVDANMNMDECLAEMIENSKQLFEDDSYDSGDEESRVKEEFELYKRNYYLNKLQQDDMSKERKREQAICYITALQWILDYYYNGVQSWNWFYPHHYAPFISDLKDFKDHVISYEMGKPFLPFQQLLAVLPAASRDLLPPAYRDLMTDPNSSVIDFYPKDFETDLNGKINEWEAVVLLPFINEEKLLKAMKDCESQLTDIERNRNRHGPMYEYEYSKESQGSCPGFGTFRNITQVFCFEKEVWNEDIDIKTKTNVCVEHPGAARNVYYPGFPTMKHLRYEFEVKMARVKVFEFPSFNNSIILKPYVSYDCDDIFKVSMKFLNQIVYIGWPHLTKAKVISISNKEQVITLDGIKDNNAFSFRSQVEALKTHFMGRMGIDFGEMNVLVHVNLHIGSNFSCGTNGNTVLNDIFSSTVVNYPAKGLVSQIEVHSRELEIDSKIENVFSKGSPIFFLGKPYFGSFGFVLDPLTFYTFGRLLVNITAIAHPDFTEAREIQRDTQKEYLQGTQIALAMNIPQNAFHRLTGSILVIAGARRKDVPRNIAKQNIGLQLKHPKTKGARAGYVRYNSGIWLYSAAARQVVQDYWNKFPRVVDYLNETNDYTSIFEEDLFPNEVGQRKVEEIVAWLAQQEHFKTDYISTACKNVEKASIYKILDAIDDLKTLPVKNVKLQVKPHLLLKPDITLPALYKPKRIVKLFDRVVIVKTTYMVPLGLMGTIVGIYPVTDSNTIRVECLNNVETFYEILFDKVLPNGNDIYGLAENRVRRVPESSILIIYAEQNFNKEEWVKGFATQQQLPVQNQDMEKVLLPSSIEKVNANLNENSEKNQEQQREKVRNSQNEAGSSKASSVTGTIVSSAKASSVPPPVSSALPSWREESVPAGKSKSSNTNTNADTAHVHPWKKGLSRERGGGTANTPATTTITRRSPLSTVDFWTPSTKPKTLTTTTTSQSQAKNATKKTTNTSTKNVNTGPISILTRQESHDSQSQATNVLKSLLGMHISEKQDDKNRLGSSSEIPPESMPSPNDVLKILPQPPLCWRSDASKAKAKARARSKNKKNNQDSTVEHSLEKDSVSKKANVNGLNPIQLLQQNEKKMQLLQQQHIQQQEDERKRVNGMQLEEQQEHMNNLHQQQKMIQMQQLRQQQEAFNNFMQQQQHQQHQHQLMLQQQQQHQHMMAQQMQRPPMQPPLHPLQARPPLHQPHPHSMFHSNLLMQPPIHPLQNPLVPYFHQPNMPPMMSVPMMPNFYSSPQGPKTITPQQSGHNQIKSSEKSAFIPLQVMRKTAEPVAPSTPLPPPLQTTKDKTSQSPNSISKNALEANNSKSSSTTTTTTTNSLCDNNSSTLSLQTSSSNQSDKSEKAEKGENNSAANSTNSEKSDEKKTIKRRPPRRPMLGAKFEGLVDPAPASN